MERLISGGWSEEVLGLLVSKRKGEETDRERGQTWRESTYRAKKTFFQRDVRPRARRRDLTQWSPTGRAVVVVTRRAAGERTD